MPIRRPLALGLVLATAALAIYLPDVGHGFVKDDFGWIAGSRLTADVLLGAPTGFFRPAVSASFAVNRSLCGLDPFCYGLANLGLLLGSALGVASLARTIGLSTGASLAAAGIWIFNWHGINMATLWISGRTALLLTLFATWGAAALLRGLWPIGLPLVLLAMLSKEEAVALPIILAWGLGRERLGTGSRRARAVGMAGGVLTLALYLLLRLNSGAFTPASAPSYYQLDFTLGRLLGNLLQYADRAGTLAGAVLLIFWIIARPGRQGRLTPSPDDRKTIAFGAVWCALGFALTIFLPVRSSLYVCFPSVGVALVAALVLERWWIATPHGGQSRAVVAGLLLPFALWPVYHARNRGSVREAELSHATMVELQRVASEHGAGVIVTLRDDPGARPTFNDAFGTVAQGAADLMITPKIVVWIDPPPRDAALAGLQPPARSDVTIALRDGVLVRVR